MNRGVGSFRGHGGRATQFHQRTRHLPELPVVHCATSRGTESEPAASAFRLQNAFKREGWPINTVEEERAKALIRGIVGGEGHSVRDELRVVGIEPCRKLEPLGIRRGRRGATVSA